MAKIQKARKRAGRNYIKCPACGKGLIAKGLGPHRKGRACKVRSTYLRWTALGLVPVQLRYKKILDETGYDEQVVDAWQYHGNRFGSAAKVQQGIYMPEHVAMILELAFPKHKRGKLRRMLLKQCRDPEIRKQFTALLRLGADLDAIEQFVRSL